MELVLVLGAGMGVEPHVGDFVNDVPVALAVAAVAGATNINMKQQETR
jgi:hypothetical protein